MTYWSIFWRSFAQMAAAFMLSVSVVDLTSDYKTGAVLMGLGLLSAAIGGLVAAGWAFWKTPATTATEKAIRSFLEKILGGLSAVALSSAADLVNLPRLLWPLLVAALLAAMVTFFSNQGEVPSDPRPSTNVSQ
jgi:hypothetical protein